MVFRGIRVGRALAFRTNLLWFPNEPKPVPDNIVHVNFNEYPTCDGLQIVTTLPVVFGETPGIPFYKVKYLPAQLPLVFVPEAPINEPVFVSVVCVYVQLGVKLPKSNFLYNFQYH